MLTYISSFTVEEIRGLMDDANNIRNMSVIAHGQSCLFPFIIGLPD